MSNTTSFIKDLIKKNLDQDDFYFNWIEAQLKAMPIGPIPLKGNTEIDIIANTHALLKHSKIADRNEYRKYEDALWDVFSSNLPTEKDAEIDVKLIHDISLLFEKINLTRFRNSISRIIVNNVLYNYNYGASRNLHLVLLNTFIFFCAGTQEDQLNYEFSLKHYLLNQVERNGSSKYAFIASRYFIYRAYDPDSYFKLLHCGLNFQVGKHDILLMCNSLQELLFNNGVRDFPFVRFEELCDELKNSNSNDESWTFIKRIFSDFFSSNSFKEIIADSQLSNEERIEYLSNFALAIDDSDEILKLIKLSPQSSAEYLWQTERISESFLNIILSKVDNLGISKVQANLIASLCTLRTASEGQPTPYLTNYVSNYETEIKKDRRLESQVKSMIGFAHHIGSPRYNELMTPDLHKSSLFEYKLLMSFLHKKQDLGRAFSRTSKNTTLPKRYMEPIPQDLDQFSNN